MSTDAPSSRPCETAITLPAPTRRPEARHASSRRRFGRLVPDEIRHNWLCDVAAGICSGIYQGCVWTFALQLARGTLHATGFQIGLATGAPCTGYIFAILWARQMEGRSKLPFVTLTWLISRGLFLLTPLLVRGTYSREAFITLICICPIIFSVSTPAYTAIMKDIYPDDLRGKLMSYVRIGSAAAMLISARVMGVCQEHYGLDYRWMFVIGGAFGVGTAIAFSRLTLPVIENPAPPPPLGLFLSDTLRILSYNTGYRWFCMSVFVTGFGNLLQMPAEYIVQVDRFHITPTQIATMQNSAGVMSMFSLFFWGWYMDRFGSLATVLVSVGINCAAPLIYIFVPSLTWVYIAAIALGVCGAGIDLGYLNTTLMFSEPGRAAHYQAIHSTLFGLRGTIAPLLMATMVRVFSGRLPWFFAFCLAIMLVGTAFQYVAMAGYRRDHRMAHAA